MKDNNLSDTLIVENVLKKNRIVIGSKGIQFIYNSQAHIKKMLKGALEV